MARNTTAEPPAGKKDPKDQHAKPPFPEQRQQMPGTESKMEPRPDHGEESYKGFGRLQGKKAIITGGDSGIGKAVAIAFAREGADVLISFLSEEEDARDTADWIAKAGRKAVTLAGDISGVKHCEQIVDRAFKEFGKVDILVNNAAYQSVHDRIEEFTPEEWDHTFKTNIHAMFYLSRAALPQMEKGGAIINTASVQAYKPKAQLLAYASTKGAIVTFTKALSQMAIGQGVRVNAVAPGPVWTPLIPGSFDQKHTSEFGKGHMLERPAQPAELAPVYVFLASRESTYVTGAVFDLTGGAMLP